MLVSSGLVVPSTIWIYNQKLKKLIISIVRTEKKCDALFLPQGIQMAKPVVIERRRKIHTLEGRRTREGHSKRKTLKEGEWLFGSTQNVNQHSPLSKNIKINKEHCWLRGYHQTLSCLEVTGKICSCCPRVNFLSGR